MFPDQVIFHLMTSLKTSSHNKNKYPLEVMIWSVLTNSVFTVTLRNKITVNNKNQLYL